MKEFFKDKKFRPASLNLIRQVNAVISNYQAQGLRLTLRQAYYQLVTQNIIPNNEHSYDNLGALISDGRLAGLIDWDAIEDRVRQPRVPSEWDDLDDLVRGACAAYRLPRWQDQDCYCELWVEKDALAGVLAPLADKFHVTLMVNRGYSSQSAMYEAAKRFIDQCEDKTDGGLCDGHMEREGVLFYLGDHDPSGEDMVRDIRDRLDMFGARVDVQKIALTTAQVRQYNPPPNPAKLSDSRAKAYIAKYGPHSWEVDALNPRTLTSIITAAFTSVIDQGKMDAWKKREEKDKQFLKDAVKKYMDETDTDTEDDDGDE